MCLPVEPYKVEKEWKHAGLSCAVVQAREAQHRCGYVRVPPGHPAYQQDYDQVDVEVHGGLTFAQLEPCTEHSDGQGWWLGFDCHHFQDAGFDPQADPKTLSEEARTIYEYFHTHPLSYYEGLHYWTQEEVVAETEQLAEQLAKMGSEK